MLREITNFVRILPPNNMRRILLLICLFVILVTPAVAQLYQYLDTQNGLSVEFYLYEKIKRAICGFSLTKE